MVELAIEADSFATFWDALNVVLVQCVGFEPTTFTARGPVPLPAGLTEAELRRRLNQLEVPGLTIYAVEG
jgi:hypothetical protein